MQELEVHWALARDSLAKATSWQAHAHDSHHHPEEYEVGDKVLVNPHSLDLVDVKGTGWKLLQRRIGPFSITEKISLVVYHLCLPAELKMHLILNIEHLSHYNKDELNAQMKLRDLHLLKGEIEYEVDRIMGHQYNQTCHHMEYLVRWRGYSPEQKLT